MDNSNLVLLEYVGTHTGTHSYSTTDNTNYRFGDNKVFKRQLVQPHHVAELLSKGQFRVIEAGQKKPEPEQKQVPETVPPAAAAAPTPYTEGEIPDNAPETEEEEETFLAEPETETESEPEQEPKARRGRRTASND